MKLQLNKAQVKTFAAKVGAFTDLKTACRRILEIFAQEGHDPVTRRDVIAVVQAMGGPNPDSEPIGEKVLDNTLYPLERAGRGYYTQGGKIGRTAVLVNEVQDIDGVTVQSKAGLLWLPTPVEIDTGGEGYYTEDAGLRRLAISQTSCFGSYAEDNAFCKGCPLARWCARTAVASIATVAADLDRKTEEDLLRAGNEAAREAKRVERTEDIGEAGLWEVSQEVRRKLQELADVDNELQNMDNENDVTWPENYSEVEIPFEGICSTCEKTIPAKSKAIHLTDVGMLHPECALAGLK